MGSATESTPLVSIDGESTFMEQRRRKGGDSVGFLLGFVFASALVGAYLLGSRSSSSSSATVSPPYEPIQRQHIGHHHYEDDFVHMDDGNSDDDDDTPKYIATQFISFTINTIGGLAEHGECEGRSVDPNGVCYLGNAENITEDITHRLAIVQRVLHRIKADAFVESPDIDHADDILKIVMMPEFFWRGPNGAYSTSQLMDTDNGVLVEVSDVIRKLISDDFFNDFLFVFGTIIAARSHDDPDSESWKKALSAKEVEYFNFASVAKGGSAHQHYYTVTKKYISGADFLSRTTLPNPSDENLHDYAEIDEELAALFASRNTTLITDNVIELDGLKIGLEICLDHRLGVLWNELRTNHHGELVDVLLITSAGMAIERGPNPIVKGGVVYLSDGEASSAACMRTDDDVKFHADHVCRGDIGGLKHIPVGGSEYSSFIGLTACWDVEDMSLLKGYYSMFQTQGCAFTLKTYDIDVMDEYTYYPPSIEIYPTVALPKSIYN